MKVLVKDKKNYWFAVYTKPRCEKKVHGVFQNKGINSYCPLTRMRKKWSDRYKMVEEPLFKSYVFVHIREDQKPEVRLTEGVVNFVYWLGKPAKIKEEEIITIKKFLHDYTNVRAEPLELKPEQHVVVNSGIMMDREGVVKKVFKNRIIVVLENIGYQLVAEFDPKHLNLITN
jgi:transcription antitermination factor NusG